MGPFSLANGADRQNVEAGERISCWKYFHVVRRFASRSTHYHCHDVGNHTTEATGNRDS